MTDRFVAIDVETANPSLGSICSLAVVVFENGEEVFAKSTFVNPRCEFSAINIHIHGVTPQMVESAPVFAQLAPWLAETLSSALLVSHSYFDRTALTKAGATCGFAPPRDAWLDTVDIARRAWPDLERVGYSLPVLARAFQLPLKHHDPLEDARVCGQVLLRACKEMGVTPRDWLGYVQAPARESAATDSLIATVLTKSTKAERRAARALSIGPLAHEVVVITGALSRPREIIAGALEKAGAEVGKSVTKETTLLIVGDYRPGVLGDKDKSLKQIKAEMLIAQGQMIRIVHESDLDVLTQ